MSGLRQRRECQRRADRFWIPAAVFATVLNGWLAVTADALGFRIWSTVLAVVSAFCVASLWHLREHSKTLDLLEDVLDGWRETVRSLGGDRP